MTSGFTKDREDHAACEPRRCQGNEYMKRLRKIVVTICAIVLSLISLGRAFYGPDMGSTIVGIIIFVFFASVSLFYLLENQTKATIFFKKINSKYLSKSVSIFGQNYEFSLVLFYMIGSYLVLALFTFAIFTKNIPYENESIDRYLFYAVFALLVLGAIYLTRTIVRFHRKDTKGSGGIT
jgi:hypothetical protein